MARRDIEVTGSDTVPLSAAGLAVCPLKFALVMLCRVADAAVCLRPAGSSFSWPLPDCLEGLDTLFRVLVESFRCVRRGAAPSAFLLGDDDDCRTMTIMMMMIRRAFGKKNGFVIPLIDIISVCGRDGG